MPALLFYKRAWLYLRDLRPPNLLFYRSRPTLNDLYGLLPLLSHRLRLLLPRSSALPATPSLPTYAGNATRGKHNVPYPIRPDQFLADTRARPRTILFPNRHHTFLCGSDARTSNGADCRVGAGRPPLISQHLHFRRVVAATALAKALSLAHCRRPIAARRSASDLRRTTSGQVNADDRTRAFRLAGNFG